MTLDERAFTRALHAAVEDPVLPDGLAARVARAHGRRRRRAAYAGGVAAVLAVAATLAVPAVVKRAEPATPVTPTGPLVTANGAVIARPGQPMRFCEIRYRADTASAAKHPPECWNEVDVTGVDLDPLDRHWGEDGDVRWGDIWVKGIFSGGTLHVVEQGSEWRFTDTGPHHACPSAVPPAGSANTMDSTAADHWRQAHPGEVVGVVGVVVDQARQRALMVVGAIHPEVVEAALRPVYGDALCVVRSRYTFAEIAAAVADARTFVRDRGYTDGLPHVALDVDEKFDSGGQAYVKVHVAVTDPAVEALAARHPAGLVRVDPWLEPA